MIAIICLIGAAKAFYATAFDKGRSGGFWAAACIATFYLSQILFGLMGLSDNLI